MRPVSPEALHLELAMLAVSLVPRGAIGRGWLRMGIDGADAAGPGGLADDLIAPIKLRGHEVIRVRADDHLRTASLRFEHGRPDPDSFYEDWWDVDGLRREVLAPRAAGGSGRIRPVRWDAHADRASRSEFVDAPPGVDLSCGAGVCRWPGWCIWPCRRPRWRAGRPSRWPGRCRRTPGTRARS